MKRATAEIIREYGPFPGVDSVAGVSHDGQHVWFASGDKLNALDPASGKIQRTIDVAAHAGTAFDGQHLFQIAEEAHPEDRPEDRSGACHDPRARRRRQLRPRVGRRNALGGAASGAEDPSGRSRNGGDPSHHRVQPLRHWGHLDRRRLWHGTWERDESELRRVDPQSGDVLETLEMPPGVNVSGLEADGGDRFFCGGGNSGKVRAVRRPRRGS